MGKRLRRGSANAIAAIRGVNRESRIRRLGIVWVNTVLGIKSALHFLWAAKYSLHSLVHGPDRNPNKDLKTFSNACGAGDLYLFGCINMTRFLEN